MLVLLASAGLVVLDKRDLARSGRVPKAALPSTAWFLVLPVYLRKRARRLGQGPLQFWVSVGCAVAGPVVGTAAVAALALATLSQPDGALPACNDPDAIQDVLNTFDGLGPVREAGVRGVSLSGQEETGRAPARFRSCATASPASSRRTRRNTTSTTPTSSDPTGSSSGWSFAPSTDGRGWPRAASPLSAAKLNEADTNVARRLGRYRPNSSR